MPSRSSTRSGAIRLTLATALVAVTAARAGAQIQLPSDRWFIDINFGIQPGSRTFTEIATPVIYDETASVTTTHEIDGLTAKLNLAGGIRFAGSYGAGAAYARFDGTDVSTTTARVPHPIQFNQPRTAVTSSEELQHLESAIHFFGLWDVPLNQRIAIALFGGPSFVTVTQETVAGIVVGAEEPPFARATIAAPVVVERKDTAFGINLGADVTYFLLPALGVGVTIRYINASAELGPAGSALSSVDAGGVQFAFGARLRFKK
jgi:hypothetical protein